MKPQTVGDITIAEIVETRIATDPSIFLLGYSQEKFDSHRYWLEPNFVDLSGKLTLIIRCYIVRTRHHTILVDTCFGNDKDRAGGAYAHKLKTSFLEDLGKAGVIPESVDYVMCTHLHVDHVGWNTQLVDGRWIPTFPNAKYLIGKADNEYWGNATNEVRGVEVYKDSVLPVIEAGQSEFVEGGYSIGNEAVIEALPGHTPGHAGLHLYSKGQEAIMSGDLMHHAVQISEPDWSTSACVDPDQSRKSRRSLVEKYADTDVLYIPAHFPDPVVGHIRSAGDSWILKT